MIVTTVEQWRIGPPPIPCCLMSLNLNWPMIGSSHGKKRGKKLRQIPSCWKAEREDDTRSSDYIHFRLSMEQDWKQK